MTTPIRILIADDHFIVREGLRLILETHPDFVLVGEAVDGMTAVELAQTLQPDVVLMDLRMPGMSGLEAIRHIRVDVPQCAVVILTTYNEDDLMIAGLRAGASSYLLKDTTREALFHAIQAAHRGESLLQPNILERVLAYHQEQAMPNKLPADSALTERERMVLVGVARGERSKEIAQRLGISERTIKAHLTTIYTKLGVDSRAGAVAVAMQRGILPHHVP